jgi:gamma-D-glutamyl-L-lysine dipeptidyl-peptidase
VAVHSGDSAVVGVTVATLWSSPEAVRDVDRPALGSRPDLAAWVDGLDHAERMDDGVLSQLTLGERVLVEEVLPSGWARVVALDQPAPRLHPLGYPGWLPGGQLVDGSSFTPDLSVSSRLTSLHGRAGGPVALSGLVTGALLASAPTPAGTGAGTDGGTGAVVDGWRPVCPPGGGALWARTAELAPFPPPPPPAGDGWVVEWARELLGVPYVWGGVTPYGIDCSGLVRLVWRCAGVALPRDASDQADATQPVPPGEERPGDLYFFARPGRRIHHVGIVTGPGRMLHACYTERAVIEEELPAERSATLVGAHRVGSALRVG